MSPPKKDYINLVPINNRSMFIAPATSFGVLKINNLKNKKNSSIPKKFIKLCGVELSIILSNLFNLSIETAVYPVALKGGGTIHHRQLIATDSSPPTHRQLTHRQLTHRQSYILY